MTVATRAARVGELPLPPTGTMRGRSEHGYLHGTFAELCRIESPSGHERRCAERVIAELRALEVKVHEDDAGASAGSECGNLLAFIPASAPASPARRSVLLCAHLDTVPLQASVQPQLRDGVWENANEGILGADNKAAIAVMLALARHIRQAGAPVDVELLFTVCEETALAGARAFDASRLRSDFGFVFDHATPIGEVVVGSPTHFRLQVAFRGAAAHAGIRPQEGRSAILAAARAVTSMRLGRLDDQSTVNVGTISGGTAMNVVPEHCSLLLEARALPVPGRSGEERAEELVAEIVDRVHEAANLPDCDCDVDMSVERTFTGYSLAASSPAVRVAEAALRACGHEPARISSGGASDANALIAQGFQTVNMANGTERNHEPGERVSALALEQMLDVALTLLDEAADLPSGAAL
ncbi:MAG TPA: M20/M25/M40 family metallo-hydrolase [Solirubrobacteraceae bacterium]|nr:M20/M25/M40 family metallo-hydrolase [Solirubrobacteraceae bacterium]